MARQFYTAAACFLVACVLNACAEPPHTADEHTAVGASDAREAVILSHAERDLLLAEMRLLLESTEGVVAGLAINDMPMVEQAAARATPSAPGTVDHELHTSLPEAFLHLGAAAHGGFEDIAQLARQGAGTQAVMTRLSETLHHCTSCHVAYRVEVAK